MEFVPAAELFAETEPMINYSASKFYRQYGGDSDDWVSEGYDIFMRAFDTHDGEHSFKTWLGFLLSHIMMERVRRKAMRNARLRRVANDLLDAPAREKPEFVLTEFMEELSEDARTVVGLVFDAPTEIRISLNDYGRETPYTIKKSVIEYLKDIGWAAARIAESFKEVKEAFDKP
jgi:DNA-directed RNA polymerase specialized sigma subunit